METTTQERELVVFHQFGKGKQKQITRTNNCVIYTRVSTKEQADNNMSLVTQRKACNLFAEKNRYHVLGEFGGTYESAKNDERKEFNRMLSFVKKSKEKISYIIVYSVDRFSRSGANAIYIKEQLRKEGIHITAVTQPTDAETASGSLQQNIQFIFSEYDNQLRREKCMTGVKEALLRGEWVNATPIGYDSIRINGKRILKVNAKGELLRQAFIWKSQGLTSNVIRDRLKEKGLNIPNQTMSHIFHNPFYCGLMAHNALQGEVVQGTHEALISKDLFLKVNGVLGRKHLIGYKCKMENHDVPLKSFLVCDHCGANIPGYIVKAKNLWYYKCRTKGCNNNRSAKFLNEQFAKILDYFSFNNPELQNLFKEEFLALYYQHNKNKMGQMSNLKKNVKDLQNKLDRLEERYVMEEISAESYRKFQEKYKAEILLLETELQKGEKEVSNPELAIENMMRFCKNLSVYWASAEYIDRAKLQRLIFPKGIRYNRPLDQCRTEEINPAFASFALLAQQTAGIKKGIPELNIKYPNLVGIAGIEPA